MRTHVIAIGLLVLCGKLMGADVEGEGLREKLLATRDMEERAKMVAGAFAALKTAKEKKDFLTVSLGAYGPIVPNEVFAPYAAELMKDGDAEVRAAAITALVNIQDKSHVDEIAGMADDPVAGIRAAVAYSFWMGGEKHAGRLLEYLEKDSSVDVRKSAFRSACLILRTTLPGEVRTKLLAAVTARLDEKDFQNAQALDMLSGVKATDEDKAFLQKVEGFLDSPDSQLRAACIDALGSMGAKSEAGTVEKFLKDPDINLQLRAVRAVNRLEDKKAVPQLVELMGSPNVMIRQEALAGVVQSGDHSTAWAVAILLADDNAEMRGKAARLIGAWKARDYFTQAQFVLLDRDPTARWLAAMAIPDLYGQEAPAEAAKMLKDEDARVRGQALDVLIRLHAYGQRKAVEEMAARETNETMKIDALKFVADAVMA